MNLGLNQHFGLLRQKSQLPQNYLKLWSFKAKPIKGEGLALD
jgi:hypothetical protein